MHHDNLPSIPDLITDPTRLDAVLAAAPEWVGLDTEFVRERTYWPQLALVQIAVPTGGDGADPDILLLDPLAPGMPEAVARVLADSRILKLMHSASEDLIALGRSCQTWPQPLFDTQVAAALCGIGAGLGYQRLVQTLLDVTIDKGETRSDWLQRPLSSAQLRYAADDVRHLAALHRLLHARLQALGRLHWLQEDCARMVTNASNEALERWPHLSVRSAQFFDREATIRLLRLLRWRESFARERDRPRSWILDNELLQALSRKPPQDSAALQALFESQPKAPRKLTDVIWAALNTPLPDEDLAPMPRADERDRKAYKRLQEAVAARSTELALPDGVLASRRWIEALQDGEDWPGALAGWRRHELEPLLAPLLAAMAPAAGEAQAAPV